MLSFVNKDLVVTNLQTKRHKPGIDSGGKLSAMGSAFSRGLSILQERLKTPGRQGEETQKDTDDDSLDGLVRREDIAQFPYVEFTGRDSITCPACQGSGRIPSGQVNELVALIPYSDQRLQPQRTKLYVVLSVVLCFLASMLVAFFLFPRSVIVLDDGIHAVKVHFEPTTYNVQMNLTSTLNISNPNFFSVLVQSINCQVLYMKKVIGMHQLNVATTISPLSERQVNFTVSVEIGNSAPYVYAFCTMRSIKVHKILVFMQTSVKTSHLVRTSQNSLEAYHYVDCAFVPSS
ncbi:transmembrane protein 106C isoform X1 [Syngnathus acus]|uniref:transmembrane protein 106C isoform X1 n=2 Tax=Syngnathus acus TaxID=161584 RepID=UPI00188623F3|nr:transmembrane protein 106C isoform X1 [Syngnathus acus]